MHHADRFVELASFDIVLQDAAAVALQHLRQGAANFSHADNQWYCALHWLILLIGEQRIDRVAKALAMYGPTEALDHFRSRVREAIPKYRIEVQVLDCSRQLRGIVGRKKAHRFFAEVMLDGSYARAYDRNPERRVFEQ